jgi:uncharacterized membrane protein
VAESRARAQRRARLDTPITPRRGLPRPYYDPESFGRISEGIARFLGTARFLVYMTLFVALWLAWNTFAPEPLQFDPRALNYTLLTLILSLQASYAAPLILLAQNRQAERDRISLDEDRNEGARLKADVDYLTREVAALRQALGEVPTRDFLRDQLREVTEEVVQRGRESDDKGLADGRSKREERTKREERERRAERKKRRAAQQAVEPGGSTTGAMERPDLSQPFVGEDDPA